MNAFLSPDRYFDPESGRISAYFSKLFILIGQESLQYCILDTEKNTFVALADFRLTSSPKTPEAFYSDISQLISEEEVLKKKYPSVVIGLDTALHTLVPAPLFDPEHSTKFLEFNFGLIGNEQVNADRLEEIDAYNVYSIPRALLDVLQANYREAAVFHRTSALIRAIYQHHKISPVQASLFLNVRDRFIDLVSFEGASLVYFNSYSCQSKEDILYYTLYTIDQLKLHPDTVQLFISGRLDSGSESYRLLEQYLRTVSFSDSLSSFDYSPLLNQLPVHRYQEIYALALCGS
jgi:hypothetical protein